MNKNPIFIEYYSHENCDCYKILNPWTTYKQQKIVLCPVSEGFDRAKNLALNRLSKEMFSAIDTPLE